MNVVLMVMNWLDIMLVIEAVIQFMMRLMHLGFSSVVIKIVFILMLWLVVARLVAIRVGISMIK